MIYLILFWTFFKIGAFTFGGGYAMIPLIEEEVINHGWMNLEELVDFIAISESTPGPFAINISTYIGSETSGVLGALCCTFGVVLPSFLIITLVAKFYLKFRSNKFMVNCLMGIKPAVIGLIGSAVISIGRTVFFPTGTSLEYLYSYSFICTVIVFIIMILLLIKKVNAISIIGLSAVLGILFGYLEPMLTT